MTKESIAHSPLPWHTVEDEFEGEQWLWIDASDGHAVCGFADPDDGIDSTDTANAAYTVQAVNMYPQLVRALQTVAAFDDVTNVLFDFVREAVDQALKAAGDDNAE